MTIRERYERHYKDIKERNADDDEKLISIHTLDEDEDEVNNRGDGTDIFTLTKKQVQALLDGKVLLLPENGFEYSMFLKMEKPKPE